MPRPTRIASPGAIFHITVRGNNRQDVFQAEGDYQHYLVELGRCLREHSCDLLAYVLMTNHMHLVLQDHQALLSRCMQILNARYTRYFNRRYARGGHLYQGRFYSKLVDADSYILQLTRYVHLNPVEAGLVHRPEDYPWSSYGAYIGRRPPEGPTVHPDVVWSLMPGNASERPLRYRGFVETAPSRDYIALERRLRRLHLLQPPKVSDTFSPKSV